MNRFLFLVFLIGGIALIVAGVNASNSVSSDFSRLFTGSPTGKAIWLLLGGCLLAALGAAGLLRGARIG